MPFMVLESSRGDSAKTPNTLPQPLRAGQTASIPKGVLVAVGDSPFQEGERDVSRAPVEGVAPSLEDRANAVR